MPRNPEPLTLAQAVRRACDLVDPDDADTVIDWLADREIKL